MNESHPAVHSLCVVPRFGRSGPIGGPRVPLLGDVYGDRAALAQCERFGQGVPPVNTKLKPNALDSDDSAVTFSPTTQGHALASAYLDLAEERGDLRSVSFSEVCVRAGVARSSAYKQFPSGNDDLIECYIQPWTVGALSDAVKSSIHMVIHVVSEGRWSYRAVLEAGTRGFLAALTQAPYTGRYLRLHPLEALRFLLDDSTNGLVQALTSQMTECTLGLGVVLREDQARSFVVRTLRRSLRHLGETGVWPSGYPEWPDWIPALVTRLGDDSGIDLDAGGEPHGGRSDAEWETLRLALSGDD